MSKSALESGNETAWTKMPLVLMVEEILVKPSELQGSVLHRHLFPATGSGIKPHNRQSCRTQWPGSLSGSYFLSAARKDSLATTSVNRQ